MLLGNRRTQICIFSCIFKVSKLKVRVLVLLVLNPGFVKLGLSLGKDKLFKYITDLGFGSKTGIDLNGEATGILFKMANIPYGFPYTISATTGYGGVLQVCGFDNELFAFDLSCPFEHNPNIRIAIDESLNAYCRECGSVYDVFYGSGMPIEGPSAIKGYSLRKYNIRYNTTTYSYMIIN